MRDSIILFKICYGLMIKNKTWLRNIKAHSTRNYGAEHFIPDNRPDYHFSSVLQNLMPAIIYMSLVDSSILKAAMII